jgi:hypothetical protein
MDILFDSGLIWWITAVDLPVMSGLFWMVLKSRRDIENEMDDLRETLDMRCTQLREGLSAFKLEVAKSYASVTDMKDLENRIVSHLLRIESKLDRTALKTEALDARRIDV